MWKKIKSWLLFIVAWFKIPKGMYCYFGLRCDNKPCPYYREFWPDKKWQNHISYCRYLDINSELDSLEALLLMDACKICGIKESDDY